MPEPPRPLWRLRYAGLLLLSLVLLGNDGSPPAAGDTAPVPGVRLRVELVGVAGHDVQRVTVGQAVHLLLSLSNPGPETISLPFASARIFDAIVLAADGQEVWRWSQGRRFAQMLSELALAPGDSREFQAACDPGAGGPTLPPGRYRVVGIIPVMGGELRSDPVSFSVEPR